MADTPILGDVRVNRDRHPVGTPASEIFEFEIWDGQQWLPAATARDIIYHIGSGAGDGLSAIFMDSEKKDG